MKSLPCDYKSYYHHAKPCNLEIDSVVIYDLYISCIALYLGSLGIRMFGRKKAMIAYCHYISPCNNNVTCIASGYFYMYILINTGILQDIDKDMETLWVLLHFDLDKIN